MIIKIFFLFLINLLFCNAYESHYPSLDAETICLHNQRQTGSLWLQPNYTPLTYHEQNDPPPPQTFLDIRAQANLIRTIGQTLFHDKYTHHSIDVQRNIKIFLNQGADFNFFSNDDALKPYSLPWIHSFMNFNSECLLPQEINSGQIDDRLLHFFQWSDNPVKRLNFTCVPPHLRLNFLQHLLTKFCALKTVNYLLNSGMYLFVEDYNNCSLLKILCSHFSFFSQTKEQFFSLTVLSSYLITILPFRPYTFSSTFTKCNSIYLNLFLEHYTIRRLNFPFLFRSRFPLAWPSPSIEVAFFQENPYILEFHRYLMDYT